MADRPDHTAADAFAQKVVATGTRPEAVNLARAFLEIRRDANGFVRRTVTINGFRGYIFEKKGGRFQTWLRDGKANFYLGLFDSERESEDAIGKGWSGRKAAPRRSQSAAARAIADVRAARNGGPP